MVRSFIIKCSLNRFIKKLESVQNNAALIKTCAIWGTNTQKM